MSQIKDALAVYRARKGGYTGLTSAYDLAPDYLSAIPQYGDPTGNGADYMIDGIDIDADASTSGNQPRISTGAVLYRVGTGANATDPAVAQETCDKIQQIVENDDTATALPSTTNFNSLDQVFGCWEDGSGNYTVFLR